MTWYINDLVKSYSKPKFWLTKPDKTTVVTRLKEIDEKSSFNYKFIEVSELQGEVPLYIERNHKTVRNNHFDLIKNKMYIKMEFMNKTMWFVINNVNTKTNNGESLTFSAYSLEYNLTNFKLYETEIETSKPIDAMNEILDETAWTVESISPKLVDKYRSFEFSTGTTVLDALYEMAESYGGILRFDTVNETIKLVHEDEECTFDGFMINDKNYIDNIEDVSDGSEIVTRLYAIGSEGMTFNTVSPTGNSYIEDFSYFMYPFERDENKKVLKSSFYMSDGLCHGLLDLKDAIELWSPSILQKFEELKILQDSSYDDENFLADAKLEYDIVTNRLDVLRLNNEYYYHKTSSSVNESVRAGYYFLQARMIGNSTGSITISTESDYGTQTTSINSGWTTIPMDLFQDENFNPDNDKENIKVSFSGGTIEYYMVRISERDFNNYRIFDDGNDDTITPIDVTKKYNIMYHGEIVALASLNVNDKESTIDRVQEELQILKDNLDERHFFNTEQLIEKNRFVFSGFWIEDTHIDEKEMYDDCLKKISELSAPNVNTKLDIYNFLNSIEEKRNWEKLKIGKKLRVKHSKIDLYSEAILSEIDFDFSSDDLSLTITGTKDVKDAEKELTKMLYDFAGASSTLALKKALYDDAANKANAASDYMKSNLDAAIRRVYAGVNEAVELSNRGIVIKNPDYPNDLLILNSGVLVLSNDGGQTFRTAITPKGITAEELVGKILITNKAWIQDENGIVTIKGDLIEITDNDGTTKVKIGQYEPGKYGMQIDGGSLEIIGGLSEESVSESFKDGIISMSEIKVIEGHIKNLSQIKVEKDKIVSNLVTNIYISTDAKTSLNTAKTSFDSAYVSLISYINTIISDKKITEPERVEYETRYTTFSSRLETLITAIQEAEKSIEDNNINAFNDQLRDDLNLTAPLPSTITMNSDGITASTTTDTNKYARLDYRGLYVQGGALDIRTDVSSSLRGMQINGNGIKAYDANGNLKFSLDASTGNISMTSGVIDWGNVNTPTLSYNNIIGDKPPINADNTWAQVGSRLTKITSDGVYTGTVSASQISAGTIYGVTISGGTINGGSISVYTDIQIGNNVYIGSYSDRSTLKTIYFNDKVQISSRDNGYGSSIQFKGGQSFDVSLVNANNYTASFSINPTNAFMSLNGALSFTASSYRFWTGAITCERIIANNDITSYGSISGYGIYEYNVRLEDKYWQKGSSSGALSSNVYVTSASIAVGGTFDNSSTSSPRTMSIGANSIYIPSNVYAGSRVYASGSALTSDRNMKKNIEEFTKTVWEEIKELKPYTYNLNKELDSEHKHLGVILQESPVEIVDPIGAVETYAYTTFILKGLKEAIAKIETLEQENTQLKSDITLIKEHLGL